MVRKRTLKQVPSSFRHLRPGDTIPFEAFTEIGASLSAFEIAADEIAKRSAYLLHRPTGYCTDTANGARKLALEAGFALKPGRGRSSRVNGRLSRGPKPKSLTEAQWETVKLIWWDHAKHRTNEIAEAAWRAKGIKASARWVHTKIGGSGRPTQK